LSASKLIEGTGRQLFKEVKKLDLELLEAKSSKSGKVMLHTNPKKES
jgi:hypothetical protein